MANTKISELSVITALAGTDVFPVVDVSANTTNKVSVEDLLRNAPDGTASAPSIANAGDQDTGILFPADNSVGVSTGGTQRLVIDSSGRVGIATSSPGDLNGNADDLVVGSGSGNRGITVYTGASNTGNIYFADGTSGNAEFRGGITYNHSDNSLKLLVNASERLRIDSSGRLLVGTTTEGQSEADDLTIATSGHTGMTIRSGTTSKGAVYFSDGTSGNSEYRGYIEYNHQSDFLRLGTAAAEKARIDSSGNVGIGTSDPDGNKLFVDGGNVRIDGAASTDATLQIRGDNSTGSATDAVLSFVSYLSSGSFGSNAEIRTTNQGSGVGQLVFSNRRAEGGSNVEALRIDGSGRLLVGTTSAAATDSDSKLQVVSTGNPKFVLARNDTSVSSGQSIGNILWYGNDSDGTFQQCASINAVADLDHGTGDKPTRLTFATTADGASSPSERMRITSTGQMRLAGAGITFNGDSAQANELDDYEEGTWTPTLRQYGGSGTNYAVTVNSAKYVKIGSFVYVTCRIQNNTGGAISGAVMIPNAPFSASDVQTSNWYLTSATTHAIGYVTSSNIINRTSLSISTNENIVVSTWFRI